jgi:GNAT superfamily N-acetyltransferase
MKYLVDDGLHRQSAPTLEEAKGLADARVLQGHRRFAAVLRRSVQGHGEVAIYVIRSRSPERADPGTPVRLTGIAAFDAYEQWRGRGGRSSGRSAGRGRSTGSTRVFRLSPSPLAYPAARGPVARLELEDPAAGPPDPRDFYFAESHRTQKYGKNGKLLKVPTVEITPGTSPHAIGFVDYSRPDPDTVFIHFFKVRSTLRGQGIGKAVISELVSRFGTGVTYDFGQIVHAAAGKVEKDLRRRGVQTRGYHDYDTSSGPSGRSAGVRLPWGLREALTLRTVTKKDVSGVRVRFESGVPVTFTFLRNTEGAPKLPRGAEDRYGQRIEPAGRYLQMADRSSTAFGTWVLGVVTFRSPIVMEHVSTTAVPEGWKARLSKAFGGKVGKGLSQAIVKAGFDAIVTVSGEEPSEMVDLTMFAAAGRG